MGVGVFQLLHPREGEANSSGYCSQFAVSLLWICYFFVLINCAFHRFLIPVGLTRLLSFQVERLNTRTKLIILRGEVPTFSMSSILNLEFQ